MAHPTVDSVAALYCDLAIPEELIWVVPRNWTFMRFECDYSQHGERVKVTGRVVCRPSQPSGIWDLCKLPFCHIWTETEVCSAWDRLWCKREREDADERTVAAVLRRDRTDLPDLDSGGHPERPSLRGRTRVWVFAACFIVMQLVMWGFLLLILSRRY